MVAATRAEGDRHVETYVIRASDLLVCDVVVNVALVSSLLAGLLFLPFVEYAGLGAQFLCLADMTEIATNSLKCTLSHSELSHKQSTEYNDESTSYPLFTMGSRCNSAGTFTRPCTCGHHWLRHK